MCSLGTMFEAIQPYQTLIASVIAAGIAYYFNKSKKEHDHESFKREIFLRYNEKYSSINVGLEKLVDMEIDTEVQHQIHPAEVKPLWMLWDEWFESEPTPRPEALDPVYDYLNLCSEEYYWYKKNYVDQDVWQCWLAGMLKWYDSSFFIQNIIKEEKKKGASYYSPDFLYLFNSEKIKTDFTENDEN